MLGDFSMSPNNPILANATNVVDIADGKRVTVEVNTVNTEPMKNIERIRDNRARARALVAAGFAKEGFIRNLDFQLNLPRIERRTEILSKEQIDEDLWSYTIKVRSGIILG